MGKTFHYYLFALILVLCGLKLRTKAPDGQTPAANSPVCHECLKIRVGLPLVSRGPGPDIEDFTEIQLPDGRFRGFVAGAKTYAIDGDQPWDMGGPRRLVFDKGAPGTYDSCGQWIHHVEQSGKTVIAWVHNETECNYANHFQTHMSTSLAISTDYGLTWKDYGRILTGMDTDVPRTGKISGKGNCSAVNGQDGYYYAYCMRYRDGATIVSRAPVSDPRPGKWTKFFQGKWDQSGLGGNATGLPKGVGGTVARWATTGETLAIGWTKGGAGLRFSKDGMTFTTFTTLPEPLMVLDTGSWHRPDPSELIAYQFLYDAKTASNQLSNSWLLVYMYIQPNEGFDKRYLVFRKVDVSISNAPVTPQVGVELGRWYNAALHDRWFTTAPVPGNYTTYKLETQSGYLMTVADPTKPSVELEDCVSNWPGHPDHMLDHKGNCEAGHYQRLRTAGWVYSKPQEQTIPLYACVNEQEHSHFASNQSDCEKLGTGGRLLGYALSQ